jgi:phosphoglycolate phosphatase-like HAD superfamily hydrolase
MISPSPSNFIFDVEGTLIDCVPQILGCWRTVLESFGYNISFETLQAHSGMDPNDMLESICSKATASERESIIKRQSHLYQDTCLPAVKCFPEVRELFAELRRIGHRLSLSTTCNKPELDHYKQQMAVDDLIDIIVCGDDVKKGKPHPDLFRLVLERLNSHRAFVVGDTPFDAIAATRMDLTSIGVLTGGFKERALIDAGCGQTFPTLVELRKCINTVTSTTYPVR